MENLIQKIFNRNHTKEEWFELENETYALFKNVPTELFKTIDDMFIDSGAGEVLYMICSGFRYSEQHAKEM